MWTPATQHNVDSHDTLSCEVVRVRVDSHKQSCQGGFPLAIKSGSIHPSCVASVDLH